MTAGGDILALTSAALESLNGLGMDFSPQEASSSSHSMFSPLPPKQAINVPLTGYLSTTKTQLKSAECSGEGGHYPDGSPPTLSPLTISARDIEGGSADFTEFCTGSFSFSDGDDPHAAPQSTSDKPQYAEMPFTSIGQDRVNFVTPSRGTTSRSTPVRIRVSASKLREIQSPHSTVSNRSAVLSHDSSNQTEGNTPRALDQPPKEIRNQKYADKATVQPAGAGVRKSLQQGVLLDEGGAEPTAALSFSDDSVIVSNGPAQYGSYQRHSRMKLLEETSQGKNAAPITHHLSTIPQQVQLVRVSTSHASQEAIQMPKGVQQCEEKPSRNVKLTKENFQAPPRTDVMETAKLVATCTAAATAAALLQASNNRKPPGDEASTPLPSAAKHDHRPARSPKHSIPAAKLIAKHPVTKSTVTTHLVQEMDKYGHKEGRVTHSGKRAITTTKQSQGQRKLHLCNTPGKEGNKLKPVVDKNSTQGQILCGCGAPYCDSCRSKDHRSNPLSPGKKEGKHDYLHPQNDHATHNSKRHSHHSAPTQSGEPDAALIDTKNDFTSRGALIKAKSVSPTSLAQSELRTQTQLLDVLKRVQMLEDYQHAHNLEVAKGIRLPTHPTSSRPSGVLNATSLPSSNSQNTDRSVRLGEQTVDESSQRQLHTDYPTDKNRFSRARMAGFPCNFSDPVECENSGLKWSGARWNLRSPTADKLDQRSGKDEDVQASPISANFRHSSLHSKINKRVQQRESDRKRSPQINAKVASGRSDSASPSPREQSPPRSEESKRMDVLVHAERVLGKVQSSRRDMEIQSELEDAERKSGDFVQALGSQSEDGCQEGISLKVTKFLSSLPLAGSAAGESRTPQSHNVDAVAGGEGKQGSKRSRGVIFDDRSTPHQHIPVCGSYRHSSSSHASTTCVTSKGSCLHSHLPCGFMDPLVKRVHAPSSLTRAPLQIPPSHIDKVDTRDKVGSSSFPCQLPPLQSRVDTTVPSVKLPEMLSGELAAAVPLGAPCIMPSPFYDELDSKPSMPNVTSMTEQSHSSAKLETEVKEPEVADIGLQTSLRESQDEGSEEFGGSKAPQSPSTQGLDTESTSTSEADEGMDAVSIIGQKATTPPACSQEAVPLSGQVCQGGIALEGKSITSEELDKRLQDHLKTQATEWIGRELLARMLSQMQCPLDPVPPHSHHDTNSCSTCTSESNLQDNETAAIDSLLGPDGVQKFIDAGIPVNKSLILDLVKDIVREEVSKLVQEVTGRPHSPSEKMAAHRESGDDYSYTPPESGSVSSSETSILSTPQATPPQSLLSDHTPDISATNELSLHADVATPTATPPLTPTEEIKETSIATPQATEEDVSITAELELYSKSDSSICRLESVVCTPSATATPEPVSVGSPPQSKDTTQPLLQDRSQQVTPIQHTHEPLSDSTTTSSSSHGGMSSTSTSSREISAGELLTQRPRVTLAMGTSFSEGEVPYSPGDARWYSLYAATMNKAGLTGWVAKPRRKLDPTMETFLDLKNSPDPSASDSSQLSEDPGKVYSIGEVRKSRRRTQEDPFKKFLSRLEALSPDSSSTPAGPASDNTLSEMPSIHHDETVTPVKAKHVQQKIQVIPYHQKYPLQKNGRSAAVNILDRLSPGEVPRHVHDVLHQRDGSKGENVWKWAVGEMDTNSKAERKDKTVDSASDHSRPGSPETNTLRDGVDVINISRHSSSQLNTRQKSAQDSSLATEDNNVLLVQPASMSSLLKVTEIKVSNEASEVSPAKIQAVSTSSMAKEASTDVVVDLEVSDSSHFSNNLESSKPLGTMLKPLTVTIPTADMNPSLEENPSSRSVSEHVDNSYSSDFDFSSISIPGF